MSTAPYALLLLAVRARAVAVPATTLVVLAVVAARRGGPTALLGPPLVAVALGWATIPIWAPWSLLA